MEVKNYDYMTNVSKCCYIALRQYFFNTGWGGGGGGGFEGLRLKYRQCRDFCFGLI